MKDLSLFGLALLASLLIGGAALHKMERQEEQFMDEKDCNTQATRMSCLYRQFLAAKK